MPSGGSTAGAAAPEPEEAAAFLNDYDDAPGCRFAEVQQATAAAAASRGCPAPPHSEKGTVPATEKLTAWLCQVPV